MRWFVPLAVATVAGCAHVAPRDPQPRVDEVRVGDSRFLVQYWPEDAGAARQVVSALQQAGPRVERWGALSSTVTFIIHPSHEALESAVRREGYVWLRAWAQYATINMQSPRTWSLFGGSSRDVEELVTHELTHCVMYQVASTEFNWPYKGIPLWFREGLASVTAEQGHRRGRVEDLWRYYERSTPGSGDGVPGSRARVAFGTLGKEGDPIADPEPMYQEQSEIVYGAAHHAFKFLVDRYGEERVRGVLASMAQGLPFSRAFEQAIGISEPEFAADFRRYVVWQGWRR